ncbi:helix-turn-helix transcriptional regulator [Elongatibacter sediminis]|uniref:Helix-turn-helix transcriptional regulator n=1 Tax=Elongatibacter sediminis TaxID=3119006 RepID=A0AAW9RE32_9GAMM
MQNTSDDAAIRELGERLARYRLNRNQTQSALAEEAGISQRTLIRLEHGESVQITSLIRVLRAHGLLHNLDALVPAPPPSPIQQVKLQGRVRQRASSRESKRREKASWSWGDEE